MGRAVTAQIKHGIDARTKASDMTYNSLLPSARTSAIAAMLMFAPVAIMLIFLPRNRWADYPGVLFHLAIFLLVSRLPAPECAKAARLIAGIWLFAFTFVPRSSPRKRLPLPRSWFSPGRMEVNERYKSTATSSSFVQWG